MILYYYIIINSYYYCYSSYYCYYYYYYYCCCYYYYYYHYCYYYINSTQPDSTEQEEAKLWALEGSYFRRLLREHAERHQARHLKLLERIHILDGLSNQQKVKMRASKMMEWNRRTWNRLDSDTI